MYHILEIRPRQHLSNSVRKELFYPDCLSWKCCSEDVLMKRESAIFKYIHKILSRVCPDVGLQNLHSVRVLEGGGK